MYWSTTLIGLFYIFPWVFFHSTDVSLPAGLITVYFSSSPCCFVRATGPGICSSSARMLFFWQPFLSDLLASHSSEHLSFVLLCFLFRSLFFFFFLLFFSWSGLFCCVLVPGTLSFHLLYLDKLRLFVLLCFTVCDHRICISLGWRISTVSGCTDVVGCWVHRPV